jgi:hypothetical protein
MTLQQSLIGWLFLLAGAFANGAFRALYLTRYLDELRANQVSCILGIVYIACAIWAINRRWPFTSRASAWRTGFLWLALTVAFEFLFFHYVTGHPWSELLRNYAFWEGRLWVFVLATILFLPAVIQAVDKQETAVAPAFALSALAMTASSVADVPLRTFLTSTKVAYFMVPAAMFFYFIATVFYWSHPRHARPIATAGLFSLVPVVLFSVISLTGFFVFTEIDPRWIFAVPPAVMLVIVFLGSLPAGLILSIPSNRRPFFRWMPDQSELTAALPGDNWLPVEDSSTHAITIPAAPAQIWPWLVQMGYGRAGWYSHDLLDNWGHHSAMTILPEFQQLKPGDLLPSTRNGKCYFEVLDLEPERYLVLGSHLAVKPIRSIPWSDPSPPVSQRSTWSFALQPAGPNETRLLVRGRGIAVPAKNWRLINAFFYVAHIIMQRKQLLTLKERVYRSA